MKKRSVRLVCLIVLSLCFVFTAGTVVAEEKPSGTVSITSKSIAIGVGVSWGEGVLTFQGKEYPFKLNGLSVLDLGISSLSVAGEVYGLNKVEDFNGKFVAGSAGAALGGGVEWTTTKNQHDVLMKLKSTQKGVKLKLAPEGLSITLKK